MIQPYNAKTAREQLTLTLGSDAADFGGMFAAVPEEPEPTPQPEPQKEQEPSRITHLFTEAGLGMHPFTFEQEYDNGGKSWLTTCDYCGTAIRYEQHIKSSDGKPFKVGNECIHKSGDAGLIAAADIAEKQRKQRQREEKRRLEIEARIAKQKAKEDAERAKNGGLTDAEVFEKREAERKAAQEAEARNENQWLIDTLEARRAHWLQHMGSSGFGMFEADMLNAMRRKPVNTFSHRQRQILAEIHAKHTTGARKGSKQYNAALAEAETRLGL